MSFILRAAFWLTVLAFLLPSAQYGTSARSAATNAAMPGDYVTSARDTSTPASDIDAGGMLTLAARSAKDMMGFCDRNPDVCAQGHAIVAHVGRQAAFYGSKLFVWLTEKAQQQQGQTDAANAAVAPQPHNRAHLAGA